MPEKGNSARSETIAYLSGLVHERFTSVQFEKFLRGAKDDLDAGRLDDQQIVVVRETWRGFTCSKKLPATFVTEMARLTSEAHHIWVDARTKNNFSFFAPTLSRIVELKRKEADYLGYARSPYDALLDAFEPGVTTAAMTVVLEGLKSFLVPFIRTIQQSTVRIDRDLIRGNFSCPRQCTFSERLARALGFDFSCGRLDESAHPFTTVFHPEDVRFTTRFEKEDILFAVLSTMHEVGHALYDQGLPLEHYGTPLGDTVSFGIHESQSRLWENMVGRSRDFWTFLYPQLQYDFPEPFQKLSLEQFYMAMNAVAPSPVRLSADEVTYNLHIIVRFEIEKALIEGTIEAADVPQIWNDKMWEYLGVKVRSDAEGVLQDVHWSAGYFGYFPCYALGNLYAAQFYQAAQKAIPDLQKKISSGNFAELLSWLRKNIHAHGKYYNADALVREVSGEPLRSRYFIDYIRTKYTKIYQLGKV